MTTMEADDNSTASLFSGMEFYLTRTLSRNRRSKISRLITKNGGIVTQTSAGATQLVECEVLDSKHPEWVATSFVEDSVVSGKLQDASKYTGCVFSTPRKQATGRQSYTVEDDARILCFIKAFEWKSMQQITPHIWRIAERRKVTSHSSQSMLERFRKHLQRKTPIEQREIMKKALMEFKVQSQSNKRKYDRSDVEAVETPSKKHPLSSPSSTGPYATSPGPLETRRKEVEEEKFSVKNAKPQSRSPSSLINTYHQLQNSDADERVLYHSPAQRTALSPSISSTLTKTKNGNLNPVNRNVVQASKPSPALVTTPATPSAPTSPTSPAAPTTRTVPVSQTTASIPLPPMSLLPKTTQPASKEQQKRKRAKHRNGADSKRNQSSLRTKIGGSDSDSDSDTEGGESKMNEDNGVFFRSVWAALLDDHNKRQRLQAFFGIPSAAAPQMSADREAEPEEQPRVIAADPTTDQETDELICQLQLETNQDMPSVVHALYYCSGNPIMARAFLVGSSPSGMWSPEDDLLLVNLVVEEGVDRAIIREAVTRGDFASMQTPRDTDAILERVLFLR